MYLNIQDMEIPKFEEIRDAINWVNKFSGVRLWHATRLLGADEIKSDGLKVPSKGVLDAKLLDWIKNKIWCSPKVIAIIQEHPLARGESLAVYGVLDKVDLSFHGIDHYKKYGSEYWQRVLGELAGLGYGLGREELLSYGRSYIIGIDINWEGMCIKEREYIVNAIFENDTHNTCIALFKDVSPNEIASIERC